MADGHLQFCMGGQDISGDFYEAEDATEVRAWGLMGVLLGAVQLMPDGQWRASASDMITGWTDYHEIGFATWWHALRALLDLGGLVNEIPEKEWDRK
jgi:hypothetical protein